MPIIDDALVGADQRQESLRAKRGAEDVDEALGP
jgi:hypothetical protein